MHIFIINPVAGKINANKIKLAIEEVCSERNIPFAVEVSVYPGHCTEIAKSWCIKGASRICSVGGDGTINEIVNGIAGNSQNVILSFIPCGSGNDFVRSLGYSSGLSIKQMIIASLTDVTRDADLCMVNNRYFINIASVGFDATVADNAKKLKKIPLLPSGLSYIISVFVTLIILAPYRIKMVIDNSNELKQNVTLVAVANGKYYGGGVKAVPHADPFDGKLDVCVVDKISRINVIKFFPKYIKGTHGNMKVIKFYSGGKIHLTSERMIPLNVDGEINYTKEAIFEVCNEKIRVVVGLLSDKSYL